MSEHLGISLHCVIILDSDLCAADQSANEIDEIKVKLLGNLISSMKNIFNTLKCVKLLNTLIRI